MYQKPYACFGYVMLANYYSKDEVFDVTTSSTSNTVLYFVKGHVVGRNKENNEIAAQYFAGSFLDAHVDMRYSTTAMEDTICFCYDPITNKGHLPEISKLEISAGQSISIPNGTKLFLCEGSINIGEHKFTGPYQIRLATGDKTLVAESNSYCLIFS